MKSLLVTIYFKNDTAYFKNATYPKNDKSHMIAGAFFILAFCLKSQFASIFAYILYLLREPWPLICVKQVILKLTRNLIDISNL